MQKYRGGSLRGSMRDETTMNDGTAANLDEEPEQSDVAEEELTQQIDVEDEIIYDEDMEDLDMNRDKSYNDRIVKFNETGQNTLQDINNTFNNKQDPDDEDKKNVD